MDTEKIRFIEELAANAWRSEIEQHLGGWRLRYAGGTSRRVNSVWPNRDPAGEDTEERVALVESFYTRYGVTPRFQLCPAAQPANLEEILIRRGYTQDAHTTVQINRVEDVLERAGLAETAVVENDRLTPEWFDFYTRTTNVSPENKLVRDGVLTRIGPPAQFVLLLDGETPCAVGLGVAERGWIGAFCVVTDPAYRRRGLATGVMAALARWGLVQGAENFYLQVMENNPPALALYDGLGFSKLYHYAYAEKR
jgi:ribosomal protein S18 acetylase RimI-like enzyme